MESKVFYSKTLSPKKLLELSQLVSQDLSGKIAIKINLTKNKNYNNINPEFYRPLVDYLQGTVIDSNSLFHSLEKNIIEFSKYFETEILDKDSSDDELEIKNKIILKKIYVGKNLKKYDSFVIISNYSDNNELGKGSLFQLSFELCSKKGKTLLLTGGKTDDFSELKNNKCDSRIFQEACSEAADVIFNYIKKKAIFINILPNIDTKDMGIMASNDPLAIDQASYDLINKNKNNINNYINEDCLIECSARLGIGKKNYELINLN